MKRLNFLILANLLFLVGIFVASLFLKEAISLGEFLLLTAVFTFVAWFFKWKERVFFIFVGLFVFGFGQFFIAVPDLSPEDLAYYNNENREIKLVGCVGEEVDRRRDHTKLTVSAQSVELKGEFVPVEGKALVTSSKYVGYKYGDCLEIFGTLQSPGEFEGFSYDDYLARYGIYSVMYRPSIKILSFKQGSDIMGMLFDAKIHFEKTLNQLFHEPHSSFAAGLITGSRRGIPDFVMESFNLTGLTHIIAISGYNITLLIVVIAYVFGFLPRFWRILLSILVIIAFTIFVGASAAVVRASIMGIISLLAMQFGRKAFVLLILFVSATLMNLWNPYTLVYDVGFQLSFAATLSLILFAKKLEQSFKWLPNILALRESFVMTLAAQVLTLPLIVFYFGRVSVVSPLANVLVGPLIPFAMMFSFFAVMISFVSEFLAKTLAFVAWLFLEMIVEIAQILAELPWASVEFS